MARKSARKTKTPAAVKDKDKAAPVEAPLTGRIGKAVELENVRRLVKMMVDNDLNELTVVEGQTRVELKRGLAVTSASCVPVAASPVAAA
ncbi:MAG: hypothetical protein NTV86_05525, partial [Planctomycetota bacterium]|nr:hypothetical protein [Planctomycetota bacterium]